MVDGRRATDGSLLSTGTADVFCAVESGTAAIGACGGGIVDRTSGPRLGALSIVGFSARMLFILRGGGSTTFASLREHSSVRALFTPSVVDAVEALRFRAAVPAGSAMWRNWLPA